MEIRELTYQELQNYISELNEKPFRAKQIWEWLWKKPVASFDEMSNLSKAVRQKLSQSFEMPQMRIAQEQRSKDGTIKIVFQLHDNQAVEGVLIPSRKRTTACISSQVGCALACTFCATGKLKLRRNLSISEIFMQVFLLDQLSQKEHGTSLSNIVLMGMGEPLANYDKVLAAIDRMTSAEGLGISPRRITLSTSGIAEKIRQLADDDFKANLAISLHTADSEKRSQLMPINKSNPLPVLADSLKYFHRKTGKRITFEYLMLRDFNDQIEDAKKLAEFCKAVPCKINLIEFNPTGDELFKKSKMHQMLGFQEFMESKNLIVNIRTSKGGDIDAACGQLANKVRN